MKELPKGLDARPPHPDPLYVTVRNMAAAQIDTLDNLLKKQAVGQRARAAQMHAFWGKTLPAALDLPFSGLESPVGNSLRELEDVVAEGGAPG
jgi:hypothetical protein